MRSGFHAAKALQLCVIHEGASLVSALRKFNKLCEQDRSEVYQANCLLPIVTILMRIANDGRDEDGGRA